MKLGIITMHNVLNYGSALQAYALQRALDNIGIENEIIDYKFLKETTKDKSFRNYIELVINFIKNAILGFPLQKKKYKFRGFYNENFKLSKIEYSPSSIKLNPPPYDIYMVGSDQVWNPKHIKGDDNFLLSFVSDDKIKISYASSFAISELPLDQIDMYASNLKCFKTISVREETGKNIIEKLLNKKAFVACDPTVLLTKEHWLAIANQSTLKLPEKYILVYELNYMFDPYPDIVNIIDKVQEMLNLPVIYLDGRKEYAFRKNSKIIKSAGPSDFIKLVSEATFVITTSFHGTVFSTLFDKPLYGVVKSRCNEDSRIISYLTQIGGEKSIISYNENIIVDNKNLLCQQYQMKILSNMVLSKQK